MKTIKHFLAVCIISTSCAGHAQTTKKTTTPVAPAKASVAREPATITGQVFVVTQGGAAIRLPLVSIRLIAASELDAYWSSQREQRNAEGNALLRQLPQLQEAIAKAQETYRDAPNNDLDLRKAVATRQSEHDEAKRRLAYLLSDDYYFQYFPKGIASAKSDADGRFSTQVPQGQYVAFAEASRNVLGSAERYRWLVSLDATSPAPTLMLSNDNTFGSPCAECVRLPLK